MVNYACAFSQSKLGKYFEWIIITNITSAWKKFPKNDFWQITKAFLWYHIKSHLGINLINWSHWDCKLTDVSKNVWGESLSLYVRNSSSCMQSIVKMSAYETNIASLRKYSCQLLNDSETIQVLIQFYLYINAPKWNLIHLVWLYFSESHSVQNNSLEWVPLANQASLGKPIFQTIFWGGTFTNCADLWAVFLS